MSLSTPKNTPEVLFHFAKALGTQVKNNTVDIPLQFGSGFCAGYKFDDHIRLLILNYQLKQDLILNNPDGDIQQKMILFKLQHIFPTDAPITPSLPSILIATRKVEPNILMPVHTHTATINIEVDANYLSGLLTEITTSTLLSSLLENDQPLLFEETFFPSILQVVSELLSPPSSPPYQHFFLRIKAEELVCRILMELEKRQEKKLLPLNQKDIQSIYEVRASIIANLDTPPVLAKISAAANMSSSKLKTLFKQIFGKSIYNYYQLFRMQEAARLLAEGNLTVSEVGYKIGFSNLSHFSRKFEQYLGLKPKKFSMQQ